MLPQCCPCTLQGFAQFSGECDQPSFKAAVAEAQAYKATGAWHSCVDGCLSGQPTLRTQLPALGVRLLSVLLLSTAAAPQASCPTPSTSRPSPPTPRPRLAARSGCCLDLQVRRIQLQASSVLLCRCHAAAAMLLTPLHFLLLPASATSSLVSSCAAEGVELAAAALASAPAAAAAKATRALGRAAEPAEDRAVVVQRRKKQRLQVRSGGSSVYCVSQCNLAAAAPTRAGAVPGMHGIALST